MNTAETMVEKSNDLDGAYPAVCVVNTTQFRIHGVIEYAACSADHYNLRPGASAYFPRGLCLLTKVTAVIELADNDVTAHSYSSSGTSYSQFAVIQTGQENFEVTRRTL